MNPAESHEFIAAESHATLTTGEVILMLRELKGWTQKTLAERSGISVTNISMLENGKVDIGKRGRATGKGFRRSSGNHHVPGVRGQRNQ